MAVKYAYCRSWVRSYIREKDIYRTIGKFLQNFNNQCQYFPAAFSSWMAIMYNISVEKARLQAELREQFLCAIVYYLFF